MNRRLAALAAAASVAVAAPPSRPSSADRQYHRDGFHCHKRDARGSYHLT